MAVNNPIVAIVGRANVGKSSLFNRLVGSRTAITDDAAGTTRDPVQGLVSWGKHNFWLVDTAGLKTASDDLDELIQDQISEAAASADLILVVADASGMITDFDRQAAKLALKTRKPVILALNKVDAAGRGPGETWERLGIKDFVKVSAIHGQGTGDLLDLVVSQIKIAPKPSAEALRLSLLGRPNVGKSSLLNSLVGKQQAIVSAQAGTTRDTNIGKINYHNQPVEILDTAGLRRRGKIEPGVEKFSTLRTLASIEQSDVCALLIDATEPFTAGDQHIAGMVEEAGKGLILVVNKWDAVEKDDKTQQRYLNRLQADFQFVWWAPVVFLSAVTGLHVTKLFELTSEITARRQTKVPTAQLNRAVEALLVAHPPAGLKNRHPRLNYVTQTGSQPPAFAFFGSHTDFLHFSYKRYLENGLRQQFDFTGTPIRLEFKDKRKERR